MKMKKHKQNHLFVLFHLCIIIIHIDCMCDLWGFC